MTKLPQLALLIIFSLILFAVLTSLLGVYQTIRPKKFFSKATPADFNLNFEEVTLTTSDNIKLAAWFIPAVDGKTKKTIIGLHGYPADKGNILPAVKDLAKNYNLLLFDFRYHGQSQGSYTTVGAKEVNDLLAAVKFLKTREIDKIGIWGFSMGGAVALMTIPKAAEIKAVVADSSYASLENMAPQLFLIPGSKKPLSLLVRAWVKLILGIDIKKISPAKAIENSTIPILIIHDRNDQVILFDNALSLQQALKNNPRAEFWFSDGQFHGATSPDYQNRIIEFFTKNLK